jgi:hypothetical protein
MTKKFEFNWQIEVPEALRTGCVFDRWTDEKDNTEIEFDCTFKVDEYGFFIYWQSEGKVSVSLPSFRLPGSKGAKCLEDAFDILVNLGKTSYLFLCFSSAQDGDVIELCQVSDIRAGGVPKVKKTAFRRITTAFRFIKSLVIISPRMNTISRLGTFLQRSYSHQEMCARTDYFYRFQPARSLSIMLNGN